MAKKKGEKYEAIIDAAVRVISANGYKNAPVNKIARAAGVAGGTVYLYFDSKEDMMVDVFKEFLGGFIEEIRLEMAQIKDSAKKLQKLVEAHLSKLENNYNLAVVCLVELRQPDPSLREATGEVLRQYFQLIEEIVEEGQANGTFNPKLNKFLARQMIFGTLDEIVTSWVWHRRPGLAAEAPQVYQMILNGLTGNVKRAGI
jgi:TetR/AcrR family fatty acid metabolism transcriptional regulator